MLVKEAQDILALEDGSLHLANYHNCQRDDQVLARISFDPRVDKHLHPLSIVGGNYWSIP